MGLLYGDSIIRREHTPPTFDAPTTSVAFTILCCTLLASWPIQMRRRFSGFSFLNGDSSELIQRAAGRLVGEPLRSTAAAIQRAARHRSGPLRS